MAVQGAWVRIFPGHHSGSKKGVVFAPPPPLFEGPKCLRGVRVKDCTWAPPMVIVLKVSSSLLPTPSHVPHFPISSVSPTAPATLLL